MTATESEPFAPMSFVLAKVKGYQPWPSLTVPTESIPSNMQTKRPKTRSICVKFYYDDLYQWCAPTVLTPLDEDTIKGFLKDAGEEPDASTGEFVYTESRRKRIVSAYLKAITVPKDDFIKWGSWGEPKVEVDPLDELLESEEAESIEEDYDEEEKPKPKGRGRKGNAKVSATTATKKTAIVKKPSTATPAKRGRKRKSEVDQLKEEAPKTPAKRGRKKKIIDIPIIDDEEDEDFVEGQEEESDEIFDDDEGMESDASDTDYTKFDKDWGLIEEENTTGIDFATIPPSYVLSNEVAEMTAWCWKVRSDIQSLIFPDEITKLKDIKRKELALEVKRRLKEEALKLKNKSAATQVSAPSTGPDDNADGEEEASDVNESVKEEKQEESSLPPLNYRSIKKSLEPIITNIIASDISKSVLRTSGLSKVISILIKTPELETSLQGKLQEWWKNTFGFELDQDERWSVTFTNAMHEAEEQQRRDIEEEKRRKRREERRLNTPSTINEAATASPVPEAVKTDTAEISAV